MAEIRQLLNIIEQLEKKLGLEAGHSMRLRLEKDSLHDMLKKSSTFDAWDRMMSSGKSDSGQATPTGTLVRTFCLSVLLNSHFFRGGGAGWEEERRHKKQVCYMCFCCWREAEESICFYILCCFLVIRLFFPTKYMRIRFSISDFFQRCLVLSKTLSDFVLELI